MIPARGQASVRVGALLAIALSISLAARSTPAGAQGAPSAPPTVLDAYVLLGLSGLDISGGGLTFDSGSIGVNNAGGNLIANARVNLSTATGVIAATMATLQQPATCAAYFRSSTGGSSCGAAQVLQPGQLPLVPAALSVGNCGLPNPLPACDGGMAVTVADGQMLSLPPGTYGDLTVNAGTLALEGGSYVFCRITTTDGSRVVVAQPSTVVATQNLSVQPNSVINPDGQPGDLRLLLNGLSTTIQGTSPAGARSTRTIVPSTCEITPRRDLRVASTRTTVVAQLCAPNQNAQLNLMGALVYGTFLADRINTGDVAGGLAPTPPPTTTTSTSTTTTSTATTSTTASSTTTTISTTTTTTSTTTTTTPTPTSSSSTSSWTTTTSSSTSTTAGPSSTSTSSTSTTAPTSTTATTSSTSTTSAAPTTSTPTSTSIPPSTSTTLPLCDELRITSARLSPRRGSFTNGRLRICGVFADAGWTDADPRATGTLLAAVLAGGSDRVCCDIPDARWMKRRARRGVRYGFWDQRVRTCPPIVDMEITVTRTGEARFCLVARRIDLTPYLAGDFDLGAVIGRHCSLGTLSPQTLRIRRNGDLVYP